MSKFCLLVEGPSTVVLEASLRDLHQEEVRRRNLRNCSAQGKVSHLEGQVVTHTAAACSATAARHHARCSAMAATVIVLQPSFLGHWLDQGRLQAERLGSWDDETRHGAELRQVMNLLLQVPRWKLRRKKLLMALSRLCTKQVVIRRVQVDCEVVVAAPSCEDFQHERY